MTAKRKNDLTGRLLALAAALLFLCAGGVRAAAESRLAADLSVDAVLEAFPAGTAYVDLLVRGTGFTAGFNAARASQYGIAADSPIARYREDGFVSLAFGTDIDGWDPRPNVLIYFELTEEQYAGNRALCDLLGDAISYDAADGTRFCDANFTLGTPEADAAIRLQEICTDGAETAFGTYANYWINASDPERETPGTAVLTDVRAAYLDGDGGILAVSDVSPASAAGWSGYILNGTHLTDWDTYYRETGAKNYGNDERGGPILLLLLGILALFVVTAAVVLLVFTVRRAGPRRDAAAWLPDFVLRYDKKKARYIPPRNERRMLTLYFAALLLFFAVAASFGVNVGLTGGTGAGSVFAAPLECLALLGILYVHLTLHELGHVLAGLLTGYRFVSVQSGPLCLCRTDGGRLRLRLRSLRGAGGLTVMEPPSAPDGSVRLLPYYLGGVAVNLLTAAGCGIAAFCVSSESAKWNVLLAAAMALELAVVNGIPSLVPGKQTDGTQIRAFSASPAARAAQIRLMRIAAALYEGKRLAETDAGLFPASLSAPPAGRCEAALALQARERALEENRMAEYRRLGALLTDEASPLRAGEKAYVALGNLYADILTGDFAGDPDAYLPDVYKGLLHKTPYQTFFAVVKHAYDLLVLRDPAAAEADKATAEKRKVPGALPQTRDVCLDLIRRAETAANGL